MSQPVPLLRPDSRIARVHPSSMIHRSRFSKSYALLHRSCAVIAVPAYVNKWTPASWLYHGKAVLITRDSLVNMLIDPGLGAAS